MNWFFIALAAPFLWSLVNITDQYLVEKYTDGKRTSGALVLFSSLIGIFVAFVIGLFANNVFEISSIDKLLLIITGILAIVWIILYLFTLEIEKVSGVVPWFLTIPVFGYILGYLFLGETLSLSQQIGSLIILFGVAILSFDFSNAKQHRFKWEVALYMIPACFIIAVIGVIFKYVTVVDQFWISSFWVYVGLGTAGVFIYIFSDSYRCQFMKMIKKGKTKIVGLNVASEIASNVGNLLTTYATLLAPVALVYLVGNFQPAILLIFTLLGTRFFPNIITEDMSKRVLFPKIMSIVIIIAGSLILFK